MTRPPRIDYPGARHHVMNRGARKQRIYPDEESYVAFLELLSLLPERFGVRIHGYALMPNHFHLMVESVRGNLSRAMQFLQSRHSQWLNARFEWDGPNFKGRFLSRVVEEDSWWMHLLAYLHLNPVRAHLAPSPAEADWTSHAPYAGLGSAPDWLTVSDLLTNYFGTADIYLEHLENVHLRREESPAGFETIAMEPGPLARLPRASAPQAQPLLPVEEAIAAVTLVTGMNLTDLREGQVGRKGNPARWVTLWWLHEVTGLSQAAIGRMFAATPATVNRSLARVRARRHLDPQIAEWVGKLEGLVASGLRQKKGIIDNV